MAVWVLCETEGRPRPEPRLFESPDIRPPLALVNCKSCGRGWWSENPQLVIPACARCMKKTVGW